MRIAEVARRLQAEGRASGATHRYGKTPPIAPASSFEYK